MPSSIIYSPHREIVRLAVPAFFALVAEPLFLLADAAIIGHLGTTELAGHGIAAAVMSSVIGLCIFLAYGTTSSVARKLGANDLRGALTQGIDGIWLAVIIGTLTTLIGVFAARPIIDVFHAGDAIGDQAQTYLQISLLGVTPVLIMLAAIGVLRGLQDTKTPLYVAVIGNVCNVLLNFALVYGLGPLPRMEIAGAALGSVIAQIFMAAWLTSIVIKGARREGASMRPDLPGIRAAGRAGVALLMRTILLRAALLVTTYAITLTVGDTATNVATHQLAFTTWTFLTHVLDAIAIAAQAITGRYLGAGDAVATREVTQIMIRWGIWVGVGVGVLVGLISPFLGHAFTNDDAVLDALPWVLLIVALSQPLAGYVFVLDGVLIGAGDGVYLAWGGLVMLVAYVPFALAAGKLGDVGWVWISFVVVFMGVRALVLGLRARGDKWMVLGG